MPGVLPAVVASVELPVNEHVMTCAMPPSHGQNLGMCLTDFYFWHTTKKMINQEAYMLLLLGALSLVGVLVMVYRVERAENTLTYTSPPTTPTTPKGPCVLGYSQRGGYCAVNARKVGDPCCYNWPGTDTLACGSCWPWQGT